VGTVQEEGGVVTGKVGRRKAKCSVLAWDNGELVGHKGDG
jgi:hypothetical protein